MPFQLPGAWHRAPHRAPGRGRVTRDWSLVWVAHAQGASGALLYRPSLVSNTVSMHATATGKAWLAAMPEEEALQ